MGGIVGIRTVLACHCPFDTFDQRRKGAAVIVELLGAIDDPDAGAAAKVLVVGAFIGILKPTPPADVIDQYGGKIGVAGLHVVQQIL